MDMLIGVVKRVSIQYGEDRPEPEDNWAKNVIRGGLAGWWLVRVTGPGFLGTKNSNGMILHQLKVV
jgi:hypothetical protein